MSYLPISPFSHFLPLSLRPALSVFASKCIGEYHAGTAALCDLGDSGLGDPRFLHGTFVASIIRCPMWPIGVFLFGSVLCLLWAILRMTHKMPWNSNCWLGVPVE